MKIHTVAQGLFALMMDYSLGKARSLFASDADIDPHRKRKNPKKDYGGTRRVIWMGSGPYRRKHNGPRGKAAIKAARKLTHIRGYYAKLRKGELTI